MKKIVFVLIVFQLLVSGSLFSQSRFSNLSIGLNTGANINFAATSYPEINNGPSNHTYFYNKKLVGTVWGINLAYRVSKSIYLTFDYNQLKNNAKKNFEGTIGNVNVSISDFKIHDIEKLFSAGAKMYLYKKQILYVEAGVCLDYLNQQTIAIENWSNLVVISETNFKRNRFVEGGIYAGFGVDKKIDTKFYLGLKARLYYLASVNTLESITLTPTLTYHF